MAHIRKTSNGRFEARYRSPDGTERASRFETRRDAQAFLDQVGVDRQVGRWRDPRSGRTLLADWVAIWQPTTVDLRASSRARDDSYLRDARPPQVRPGATRCDKAGGCGVVGRRADQRGSRPGDGAEGVSDAREGPAAPRSTRTSSPTRRAVASGSRRWRPMRCGSCRRTRSRSCPRRWPPVTARWSSSTPTAASASASSPACAAARWTSADVASRVAHNAVEVRGKVEWGAPKTRAGRRTVPMTRTVAAALEQHLAEFVEDDPAALVFAGADGGVLRARGPGAAGSGGQRSAMPASTASASTTSATPRCRCGSQPARARSRSRPGRATRACRWCSTATDICTRATRPTCSHVSIRSPRWPLVTPRPRGSRGFSVGFLRGRTTTRPTRRPLTWGFRVGVTGLEPVTSAV